MMKRLIGLCGLVAACASATPAFAMETQTARLTLWHRGEALDGDDLLAANEAVVDYLATLPRPTDPNDFHGKRYTCQAKARPFQTSAVTIGSTQTSTVEFEMVYDLKECVPAN